MRLNSGLVVLTYCKLSQLQLRDLRQGTKRQDRKRSYDMVEVAQMEHRHLQFLYSEGEPETLMEEGRLLSGA